MVRANRDERPRRQVFKTYIALLPVEWEKLRFESEKRRVTGRELIEGILSRQVSAWPTPPKRAPEAPVISGEEGDWTDSGSDG